jgi:hypothetical protein
MRRAPDPLALDPLGVMGVGPIADDDSPSDPLALDPLSPVDSGARPVDAHANAAPPLTPRHLAAARARTRDVTRHSPGREQARAGAKVTT